MMLCVYVMMTRLGNEELLRGWFVVLVDEQKCEIKHQVFKLFFCVVVAVLLFGLKCRRQLFCLLFGLCFLLVLCGGSLSLVLVLLRRPRDGGVIVSWVILSLGWRIKAFSSSIQCEVWVYVRTKSKGNGSGVLLLPLNGA